MVEMDTVDTLQAVIVADSFTQTFAPLTGSQALGLLPLANIPLLDYSIEFLARNKVKKVIVICTEHAEAVEAHVSRVRVKGCKIKCFADDSCKSVGDVLRRLDDEQLVNDDFILVQGAVVSNMDLSHCLAQHRDRRKKDSGFVLTKIFRSLPSVHRLRTESDQLALALIDDQIVKYDDLEDNMSFHYQGDYTKPCRVRCDLVDTGVSICTSELLSRFTDNFDFQTVDQVVRELLSNEVYTDKVAAYVAAPHCYVARAQDPRTYDAITRDVLSRWAHPIVLNCNLLPYSANPTYRCQHNGLYVEDHVRVAYSATITPPSALGTRTTVADRSIVEKSVLGRDCRIGENVRINGAYLWDQVSVESEVEITQSIIGAGCVIGTGSKIPTGCILDMNVILPENTVLQKYSRLSRRPPSDVSDPEKLGNAYVLPMENSVSAQQESIGGRLNVWTQVDTKWDSADSTPVETSGEETDSEAIYDETGKKISGKASTHAKSFVDEVKDLVIEAMSADEDADALLLSINNLKYTQNRGIGECIAGIVRGLFAETPGNEAELLLKWKDLLQRYMMGVEEQLLLIREIETVAVGVRRRFHVVLSELYKLDIIEGRSIIQWSEESQDSELKSLTAPLVSFLQEEEDEEDDD